MDFTSWLQEKLSFLFAGNSSSELSARIKEILDALILQDVHPVAAQAIINSIMEVFRDSPDKVKNPRSATKMALKNYFSANENPFELIIPTEQLCIIVVYGVHGSGKTTFCGKLASFLIKSGHNPTNIVMTSLDYQRLEGQAQLSNLAKELGVGFIKSKLIKSRGEMINLAINACLTKQKGILILDTPGWSPASFENYGEIEAAIREGAKNCLSFCIMDRFVGKKSAWLAKKLSIQVNFDFIVLTKMDGEVLIAPPINVSLLCKKPIAFVASQAGTDGLELFNKEIFFEEFLDSIFEQTSIDAQKLDNEVPMETAVDAMIARLKNMLKRQNLAMVANKIRDSKEARIKIATTEKFLKKQVAILSSMNKKERMNPQIIDHARALRMALGSGVAIEDVISICKKLII